MPNNVMLKILFFYSVFFLMGSSVAFSDTTTHTDNSTIKIGMTVPLTGEMRSIGEGERTGVQIYFDRINAAGGIGGKKLELVALDDAYDPVRAARNIRQLIAKDHVIAFMGNMGSAPGVLTLPIINNNKIVLFAPVTGNAIYRKNPPDHYIFNFRSSLNEETAELVKGVLSIGIKPEEIAFFTQQDSFGQNVYQGATQALSVFGFQHPETLPQATFARGTVNVENALAYFMQSTKFPPKAFILGGNYAINAKFIKLAKKEYPNAIFLSVSDRILPSDFKKEEEKNVITIELVPDFNSNLPAIVEYHQDLQKYAGDAQPNAASLEGYLSAKLFVKALQKTANNNITSDELVRILETMQNVDIGIGITINFDKKDHQALHRVWPLILKDGKFIPFNWSDLKQKNNTQ